MNECRFEAKVLRQVFPRQSNPILELRENTDELIKRHRSTSLWILLSSDLRYYLGYFVAGSTASTNSGEYMGSLDGKVALVTGAGGMKGIGRAPRSLLPRKGRIS